MLIMQLKKNTRVMLPLWLGEMLAIMPPGDDVTKYVELYPPDAFAPRVLNALKADPRTVDLRSLAPHFYMFAERYLNLCGDDEDEAIIDVLTEAFRKRAAEIADHARNPQGARGIGADFLSGLDETERKSKSCCKY
jgi:GINS complex subunit 3